MMLKVLLLDDNHDNRFITARILKQLDCEVIEFNDPVRALSLFKYVNPFDVIFTDLHMPKLNGIEFIEQLLALHPTACIVAVSVSAHPALQAEALVKGASYTLFGNCDKSACKAILDAILNE